MTVSTDPTASFPGVAVNRRGNAVAFWKVGGGGLQAAYRSAGTNDWGEPTTLATVGYGPGVALDDRGNAIAMWSNDGGTYASFRPASSVWRAPVQLDAAPSTGLHVAFDRRGNALAAWSEVDGSGTSRALAAYRPAGRGWVKVETFAPRAYLDDLEVDREGNALALLTSYPSGRLTSLQRIAAEGTWRSAGEVAPSGWGNAALAADDAGNAVVLWDQFESADDAIKAAIHPARSTSWRPSLDLATQSVIDSVDIAMDMAGNALAAWSGGGWYVAGNELRARGPLLETVSVPDAGRARVAVQFRVRAVPWGAPLRGDPRWSFGDRKSARGTRVSHVYTRRGHYTVRVSQTDAAGETSTATATIVISGASGR